MTAREILMRSNRAFAVTATLVCAALVGCKSEQKDTKAQKDTNTPAANAQPAARAQAPAAAPATKPLTYEDSARVVVSAKVKAIDQTTRQVTLADSSGDTVTFVAGKEIQRLNEVK